MTDVHLKKCSVTKFQPDIVMSAFARRTQEINSFSARKLSLSLSFYFSARCFSCLFPFILKMYLLINFSYS